MTKTAEDVQDRGKITIHSVEQADAHTLLIVADVGATLPGGDPHPEHPIYVPVAAIGSRMALYGLSPDEALQAILREHYVRLNPGIPDPESREHAIEQMKQLRKQVKVVGGDEARPYLEEHADAIFAAHRARA